MRTGTVIAMAVQQMTCTGCGAEANVSCNCGKPYVPAKNRVREYDQKNPGRSTREAAADLGISNKTVSLARNSGVTKVTPPERDDRSESEIESEHEEGLRVVAARGFLNRASEAKEIATLGKLAASDITEAMIVAADEAAAAWNVAAQNLRRMKANG